MDGLAIERAGAALAVPVLAEVVEVVTPCEILEEAKLVTP
jgi:hypothetical protein